MKILVRVVVMGLFEIDRVEYSDLVVIALEELATFDYDAAFRQDKLGCFLKSHDFSLVYVMDGLRNCRPARPFG